MRTGARPRIIDKEEGRGTNPLIEIRYQERGAYKEPPMNWYLPIMRKPRGGFPKREGNNEEKGGAVQRTKI